MKALSTASRHRHELLAIYAGRLPLLEGLDLRGLPDGMTASRVAQNSFACISPRKPPIPTSFTLMLTARHPGSKNPSARSKSSRDEDPRKGLSRDRRGARRHTGGHEPGRNFEALQKGVVEATIARIESSRAESRRK